MSYCQGSCDSSSMYSDKEQTMNKKCSCCQETKTELVNITLNCPSGKQKEYSYINVKSCSCVDTHCKEYYNLKDNPEDNKSDGSPEEDKTLESESKENGNPKKSDSKEENAKSGSNENIKGKNANTNKPIPAAKEKPGKTTKIPHQENPMEKKTKAVPGSTEKAVKSTMKAQKASFSTEDKTLESESKENRKPNKLGDNSKSGSNENVIETNDKPK
ncbi:hypothetical protein GDO86_008703 [Hymenochirus boettgeri]|uniref:CTCK domain-containing protein n=1 Tax=Hymenochirus boettgeri TaxID=247094 RepID=A0A8T2J622_9PIPI|nr:hypothetical protein GDO86_008703 [Hymenochirus boettgeri]